MSSDRREVTDERRGADVNDDASRRRADMLLSDYKTAGSKDEAAPSEIAHQRIRS